MKLLLLLAVIAFAIWLFTARRRNSRSPRRPPASPTKPGAPPAAAMIACVHCGVHLPQPDTVADAQGRRYCSEAHRLAGPR